MAAPRGKRHGGREAKYDPACGQDYKPGNRFKPDNAMKLIRMAEMADLSVSELLNELVAREPVDADGRPLWADGSPQMQLTA